ncbi:hypothetical protein MBM_06052 [Drepanopeziza brunnea f. sp. 'multigermtubi' MB_m1]|uniref:Uncharacterized protein n=1 Tax=Marssonina brunnea f. sp. multigermtubi (strain MB_m1) TaxID=1072389 RepID=K1WSK4_MARBU|nr:uncharacterized protein MBM_06052 [Drepanopeziza brunnea f. sp. 'multigermtubi' MB_m1]EKD16041.1 hypothetical protein MBM_06052 [Drepanopeziza brunnea f. sp. 'multigermtubi' MB_m1]
MAPDLNSVPPSPRPITSSSCPHFTSRTTSRRTSHSQQLAMAPQTLPSQSTSHPQSNAHASTSPQPVPQATNILPSNQAALHQATSPPLASPSVVTGTGAAADNTGVGAGPGPLRHPRPLTAADLHLQLEKEQEAVVNRLTRELSLLRAAQNASVVSNTSSTSAGLPDTQDYNANHLLSGPSHPAPSSRQHHRSSSTTSNRSINFTLPSTTADRIPQSISLSRQNSSTGSQRAGSPAPLGLGSSSGSYHQLAGEHFPSFYSQRPVPHRDASSNSVTAVMAGTGSVMSGAEGRGVSHEMLRADSVTSVQTSGRYDEAAYHRQELDSVKRENEGLKRRIRELERTLRARRESDASAGDRMRSESVSTTASVRDREGGGASLGTAGARGRVRPERPERGERERDEGAEIDTVQVGESARSAGL